MLKLSTTQALKSLVKNSSLSQLRSIYSTRTLRMACVYNWPTDSAYKDGLNYYSSEENSISRQIEQQKQKNKSKDAFYEEELCKARSLLAYVYEKSDKKKLDADTVKHIDAHLLDHKVHRIEEHNLVIKWIEQGINALKDNQESLRQELQNDLNTLKKIDVNSLPFLYERELQIDISNKLKK